ncbi:mCG147425 [Mus musculus]|nr:mCG147425 [Mus musculus]
MTTAGGEGMLQSGICMHWLSGILPQWDSFGFNVSRQGLCSLSCPRTSIMDQAGLKVYSSI